MFPDQEMTATMQDIAKRSMSLMAELQSKPQSHVRDMLQEFTSITQDYLHILQLIMKEPEKLFEAQFAYWQDAIGLFQSQMHAWMEGKPVEITDKRFSSEEWLNQPFFSLLSQQYLLATEHFSSFLATLDYQDAATKKRLNFLIQQYLDAISPSNFIHTNPKLMAETLQSHGKNLMQGLKNFLNDFDGTKAKLMVKMTDMQHFKVGGNLATTAGKVIYQNDMMELIQYTPKTKEVRTIPLLIIPPWINKYYILDLSKHNSMVNYLVSQGITVFMISWVNPDASLASKSFYDYMAEGPLEAIEIIKKQLQVNEVNTLGFCIGGTLLACTLAYMKAKQLTGIKSATFLAAMIDFSDPGDISVFIDEEQIKKLEQLMNEEGFLDGRLMAQTFNSLRANDLIWSFFVKNYLQGKQAVPFDILYWNADTTNMPATMHSQYLRWMYLNNALIEPNKIQLNDTPLDVSAIDIPTFFVATIKDHIAPWQTVYKGYLQLGGKKQFILGESGHIAGIINPSPESKYGYLTNQKRYKDSSKWLSTATRHDGSWWPCWHEWLCKQSGALVTSPDISKLPLKGLADAPGSYVFKSFIKAKE